MSAREIADNSTSAGEKIWLKWLLIRFILVYVIIYDYSMNNLSSKYINFNNISKSVNV